MADSKGKTIINWQSDNLDTYIYSKIFDINMNLAQMPYSSIGVELPMPNSLKTNTIIYDNDIVKENGLFKSHVSSGAAIVAMNRFNYGKFVIPPSILEYIQEEKDADRLNEKNLPKDSDDFEKGRLVYEMFKELGYDDEAAFALAGACWVESRWDCHAVNRDEIAGKNKNTGSGWNNAGEGYFQITFWGTKYKVIKALNLPGVYGDSKSGYTPTSQHLCDLDESHWKNISEYFLKTLCPEHDKVLRDDTDQELQCCASYLFKAAPGKKIDLDNVKEVVKKYMNTHQNMYGSLYHPHNGFCYQILASYVLSKYLEGQTEINLDDIGVDYSAKGAGSSIFGKVKNFFQEKVDMLNVGLFKRNPKGWSIQRACQWINQNAKSTSQHVCAKFVRMAIEAGGISTNGRPNWAWQYINYLPNIGFKFLCKAKRNDTEYKPEPGDIAVYMKNGDRTVPGHICMWSGKEWCSDFKQKNMIVYSGTSEAYIFRFEG